MANIDNLGGHIDGALIAQAQAQKEVTANALLNLLSNATQGTISLAVTIGSPAEFNLTADQFFGNFVIQLTGNPGADFDLKAPPGGSHSFAVDNASGSTATPKVGTSGAATVASGKRRIFHSDGATIIPLGPEHDVSGGGGGGTSTVIAEDLDTWFQGSPGQGQVIRRWIMTRQVTLPAEFSGSQAYVGTAPADGAAVFDLVHEDGSSPSPGIIGTLTFGLGSKTGIFDNIGSPSQAVTLNPGDTLELRAPSGSPQDSALADISLRIKGDGIVTQAELSESPITPDNTVSAYNFDVSTYAEVEFQIDGLGFAASGRIAFRFSTDNGSTYILGASDYRFLQVSAAADSAGDADFVPFDNGAGTSDWNGVIKFTGLRAGRAGWQGVVGLAATAKLHAGFANFNGPITHIKIYERAGSNNFSAGTIRATGLRAA